jgi:hypothetical protein
MIGCMAESRIGLAAAVHFALGLGGFQYADLDADLYRNGDAYLEPERHRDGYPDLDADGNGDCHADVEPERHVDLDADGYIQFQPDSDGDRQPHAERHSDTDAQRHAFGDPQCHGFAYLDPAPHTHRTPDSDDGRTLRCSTVSLCLWVAR